MEPVIAGSIPVRHPLEDAAEWPATGLENQGIANNYRGSIPPSSFDHWEPESAALC